MPKTTNLFTLLFFISLFFSTESVQANEKFFVPVDDVERGLIYTWSDGKPGGLFVELTEEILKRAGIDYELIPTSKNRRRLLFVEEKFFIECCSNPAWNSKREERSIQLFSNPVYYNKDVYIFPKGKAFDVSDPKILQDKKVVTILGYGYSGSRFFGERVDVRSEEQLIQLVGRNRGDVGIVNEHILQISPHSKLIEKGPVHETTSVHFRINKKVRHLMPKINGAIDDMLKDGTRDRIVNKHFNY